MTLTDFPYIQVALDIIDLKFLEKVLSLLPSSNKLLIEAGTPLIKKFGSGVINTIRQYFPDSYVIADMKTLDVGEIEVKICSDDGANAMAVSGLAPLETIVSSIKAGKERNIDIILDLMNVAEPLKLLSELHELPKIVLFHRGIDQEGNMDHPWDLIQQIRKDFPQVLVAVAGGLNLDSSAKALSKGAQIIVVGRAITASENITKSCNDFLKLLE
ncbi:MAG: orotidine 5'-phosphate decarboxylase [Candidatus Heimdallarchaeum aukensis]|uniref:Orotidine 5'-phosphate decarboxylase n=1 Tax=Candidatus Heimdallarchaeum aukensis TaxID=2876573 RepID=A0A9Y1BKH1_9ARCH|nr:MAG: orotidine 5'-phosphate decarboxylase [Candidatus Heimdallarchaeum aukensis]